MGNNEKLIKKVEYNCNRYLKKTISFDNRKMIELHLYCYSKGFMWIQQNYIIRNTIEEFINPLFWDLAKLDFINNIR